VLPVTIDTNEKYKGSLQYLCGEPFLIIGSKHTQTVAFCDRLNKAADKA